jgi:hypothetical protein
VSNHILNKERKAQQHPTLLREETITPKHVDNSLRGYGLDVHIHVCLGGYSEMVPCKTSGGGGFLVLVVARINLA